MKEIKVKEIRSKDFHQATLSPAWDVAKSLQKIRDEIQAGRMVFIKLCSCGCWDEMEQGQQQLEKIKKEFDGNPKVTWGSPFSERWWKLPEEERVAYLFPSGEVMLPRTCMCYR